MRVTAHAQTNQLFCLRLRKLLSSAHASIYTLLKNIFSWRLSQYFVKLKDGHINVKENLSLIVRKWSSFILNGVLRNKAKVFKTRENFDSEDKTPTPYQI